RLYGEDKHVVMDYLRKNGTIDEVQDELRRHFNIPWVDPWTLKGEGDEGAEWLANILGLSIVHGDRSESRFALSFAQSATLHCHPYNYLAGITCTTCHQTHAFRFGAFTETSNLH